MIVLKKDILNNIKISIFYYNQILTLSRGEVKNPFTLNYKDLHPIEDGLFCNKIFGSPKLFKCFCENLSGINNINSVCELCFSQILHPKFRRNLIGHIKLNDLFLNTLFYKSIPSYLSLLLNISTINIENILYNNYYLVIYPGKKLNLKLYQVLNFSNYYKCYKKFKNKFYANTGFKVIEEALNYLNVFRELKNLKKFFKKNNDYFDLKYKKNLKRYLLFKFLKNTNIDFKRILIKIIPVMSPNLRPIVKLSNDSLVTSDLNYLYKKIIIRNIRLKNLFDINAPNIIIDNEKKLLQDSINNLFIGGGTSPSNYNDKRSLKSLLDNIKGKTGYFRQNLLGKRVDYSGRAVIVSGPFLKLGECALPVDIALELFKPFLYNKLFFLKKKFNFENIKNKIHNKNNIVIKYLIKILKNRLIILNRAPTLHRLNIQAFKVILTNDKVIKLHPLVCSSFNADFDGDQMAIHIPLSIKVNIEFKTLLLTTRNILHPSNGDCCILPTQDIILGLYYFSKFNSEKKINCKIFNTFYDVRNAYNFNIIKLNDKIFLRIDNFLHITTFGRLLIFNSLPKGVPFSYINKVLKKKDIFEIYKFIEEKFGVKSLIKLSDNLMTLGFSFSTKSGISICMDDIIVYDKKNSIIKKTKNMIILYNNDYLNGLLSEFNRKKKLLDIWELTLEIIFNRSIECIFKKKLFYKNKKFKKNESLNSLYIMLDSGARGSYTQIEQICGMRGLISYKNQNIMEIPVISSLKEGLKNLEYFYFSHNSRKSLADTALKTSNAGYLTRRLIEISNNLIITEFDCGTCEGIICKNLIKKGVVIESFFDRIIGRFICENILDENNNIIYKKNTLIIKEYIKVISNYNINIIKIRSPIKCISKNGICSMCYGYDLSKNKIVHVGSLVGIIAAQSIGEPGTQLTMRTFHTGGALSKDYVVSCFISNNFGYLNYSSSLKFIIKSNGSKIVISNIGKIEIKDFKNNLLELIRVPYSSKLFFDDNSIINIGDIICEWDPYYDLLLSPNMGYIKLVNFFEGINYLKRLDNITGNLSFEILQFGNSKQPILEIFSDKNYINCCFQFKLSPYSFVVVSDFIFVNIGDILVKKSIDLNEIRDTVGGLIKIADLFEARHPKFSTILSPDDGIISIKSNFKKNFLILKSFNGKIYKQFFQIGRQVFIKNGDYINKGDVLIGGNLDPHDILNVCGVDNLIDYYLSEIKYIYFSQGVKINDKHIEIILKQMLSKIIITEKGNSKFIVGEILTNYKVCKINKKIIQKKGKLIKYDVILIGITKFSKNSESFLSSISFQETASALVEASFFNKIGSIKYLKENVMLGRVIPAGTGYCSKILKKYIK